MINEPTSQFVSHEPCEACGSSDANALYSDGHLYCHSCGAFTKGDGNAVVVPIRPRQAGELITEVMIYEGRGISADTSLRFLYFRGNDRDMQVEVAGYCDGRGKPVAQKLRTPGKRFFWLGAKSQGTLFGQHLYQNEPELARKTLVICEGEIDALSVAEVFGQRIAVVSVPDGAAGAKRALVREMEFILTFDEIVICFDSDLPGQRAAAECYALFQKGAARVALLPLKDPNAMLKAGRKLELKEAIYSAGPPRESWAKIISDPLDAFGEQVVEETMTLLLDRLATFGNQVSHDHEQGLRRLVTRMTSEASGQMTGRYLFDASCGMGKSQATVCLIATAWRLGAPWSILVAASMIEALCDMKRDLISLGVPEDKVALRYGNGVNASLSGCTDEEMVQRPIALISHARFKTEEHLRHFNTYRREDRSLVIHDECLLTTEAQVVKVALVQRTWGWLSEGAKAWRKQNPGDNSLGEARSWLKRATNQLAGAIETTAKDETAPKDTRLPAITRDEIERWTEAVHWAEKKFSDASSKGIRAVVELFWMGRAKDGVRVGAASTDGICVTYKTVVPDEIKNLIVLDASLPWHPHESLDPTMTIDPEFGGIVKDHSAVTLEVWRTSGGRHALQDWFCPRSPKKKVKELVERLENLGVEETAIVFSHLPHIKYSNRVRKDVNVEREMKKEMVRRGMNPGARNSAGDPKYTWGTWGKDCTGVNTHSHCTESIFVSTLYQSPADVFAAAVGQMRDLNAKVINVEQMVTDLATTKVFQAASRTRLRTVEAGHARSARIVLCVSDKKMDRMLTGLRKLMPGIQVKDIELKYCDPPETDESREMTRAIVRFLEDLAFAVKAIPCRSMWATTDPTGSFKGKDKRRRRAIDRALETLEGRWFARGQSMVRAEF